MLIRLILWCMLLPTVAVASPLEQATALLGHYENAYEPAKAAWPGFEPAAIPKVIIARDETGETAHLLIMDHPKPNGFGPAVQIPYAYGKAYLVVDPIPDPVLDAVGYFDFSQPLHGAPTFLIASQCAAAEIMMDCMHHGEFVTYYLHEVFHRWQDDHFVHMDHYVDQTAYDFSADSLAAVLLETEVLRAAIKEDDVTEKHALARQFVALRTDRAARFQHVELDDQQERIEGTAFFLEQYTNPDETDASRKETMAVYLDYAHLSGDVKDEIGFGRFYTSGAAILQLAITLGAEDVTGQITNEAAPAQVLSDMVTFDAQEQSLLIQAAKRRFALDGVLAKRAKELSNIAAKEPDIFSDY